VLTPEGEEQILALATILQPLLVEPPTPVIYSSPAAWVIKSAKIFGKAYGVQPIEFQSLFLRSRLDPKNVVDLIARLHDNLRAVVLFSHHDLIPRLAIMLSPRYCRFNYIFPEPREGEAYIFHLQKKRAFTASIHPKSKELRIIEVFH
jgi:phosphohistidine phosphatase SixA